MAGWLQSSIKISRNSTRSELSRPGGLDPFARPRSHAGQIPYASGASTMGKEVSYNGPLWSLRPPELSLWALFEVFPSSQSHSIRANAEVWLLKGRPKKLPKGREERCDQRCDLLYFEKFFSSWSLIHFGGFFPESIDCLSWPDNFLSGFNDRFPSCEWALV